MSGNRRRALLVLACLSASLLVAAPAWAGGNAITGVFTPYKTISSAGPLEDIYVGNDLSCQITREGEFQVYDAKPGDCGTFITYGGVLYTPDFEDHEGEEFENPETEEIEGPFTESSATPFDSLAEVSPVEVEAEPEAEHNQAFTPVSQSEAEGAGTAQSPYTVTTVVDAGTEVRLTQVDSYVVGNDYYTVNVSAENLTESTLPVRIYRGQDCYLGGVDQGYGLVDGSTPACTSTPNNEPAGFIEALVPAASPASHYLETGYYSNWQAIGSREALPDTCDCETLEDNGDSVSWDLSLGAGESQGVAVTHVFSENGELPEPPPSPTKPVVTTPPHVPTPQAPVVGGGLKAEPGSYEGAESYEYQWQFCATAEASSCQDIAGAIGPEYTPTSHDAGGFLRFVVKALNGGGVTESASPLIGPVTALAGNAPVTVMLGTVAPASTPAATCSSARSETIHWKVGKHTRLKNVLVTVSGHAYRKLSGGARSVTVSLAGRGAGKVVVKILGTTKAGGTVSAARSYQPCVVAASHPKLKSQYLTR